MKNILVTSALPYANGQIHLGHLVEYIQTDIWVRYQKMAGNQTYYFCADDTHGTPIMLAAKKAAITPEQLIAQVKKDHYRDLSAFHVDFTNFHSTHSPENEKLAVLFFNKANEKGHINKKQINQAYCEHDKMFLPDRFIKGTCPKCKATEQYGDSCEVCGTTYSPTDLIDAQCALCGTKPIQKESDHYFFKLSDFSDKLQEWYAAGNHVNESVAKKMQDWFEAGLNDWDISRDGPYFGFKIPGEENKFFYVWMDAPIGYIASALNYFEEKNQKDVFEKFWQNDNEFKIYHFIGKDIMYFHTLFWPAQLMAADFKTPNAVFVHGFLTINGEKMSKSKGTFIQASTYSKHLDPNYLRFYYATKLSDTMDDLDLNLDDFLFRVNSDLVGNFINIFSRSASIAKKLDNRLGHMDAEGKNLCSSIIDSKEKIQDLFRNRQFAKAMKEITSLGDIINKYIHEQEPWQIIKQDSERARVIITNALNAAKILAGYLKPVLPELIGKIEDFFRIEPITFNNLSSIMEDHQISQYQHLIQRVDKKQIEKMLQDSKQSLNDKKQTSNTKSSQKIKAQETNLESSEISIDDLFKVDLRVGLIIDAKDVPEADKLLQLTINLGELGTRNVFAGIKKAYSPQELIQKKCVVVANLKPRKMKFGVSEAMIMATGEGESLSLMIPDKKADPGDKLK